MNKKKKKRHFQELIILNLLITSKNKVIPSNTSKLNISIALADIKPVIYLYMYLNAVTCSGARTVMTLLPSEALICSSTDTDL